MTSFVCNVYVILGAVGPDVVSAATVPNDSLVAGFRACRCIGC